MGPDRAIGHHEILNACYMVRHYRRGGHQRPTSYLAEQRSKAIQHLGRIVRDALNGTQDFEPILTTLVLGLSERDEPPF